MDDMKFEVDTCPACRSNFTMNKPEVYITNHAAGGYILGLKCPCFNCGHKVEYAMLFDKPFRADYAVGAMEAIAQLVKTSFVLGINIKVEAVHNE